LTARGFFHKLCETITSEIENIQKFERTAETDLSLGLVLKELLDLFVSFVSIPSIKKLLKQPKLLHHILEGYFRLRSVIIHKTKFIDESAKILSQTLEQVKGNTEEDSRSFLLACVHVLQNHHPVKDAQTCAIAVENLCNIICPIKPKPIYRLLFKKSSTQEEFIRGNMVMSILL